MKALKIIGIIIAVLIAVVLVLGIVTPNEYNIERTVEIKAPKNIVYANVSSLKKMSVWSPWEKKDPEIVTTLEGEDGTVGSKNTWSGNEKVGKGSQEITNLVPNEKVETKLVFIEPWESECVAYFNLEDTEEGMVKVVWGFSGETPFPFNALSIFMNMDAEVGKDFEEGLANLKQLCEEEAANSKSYSNFEINEVEFAPKTYICMEDTVKFENLGEYMQNLGAAFGAVTKAGLEPMGAPSALYYTWDEENEKTFVAVGVPVAEGSSVDGFVTKQASGKALHIAHYGAYEKSMNAHIALNDYIKDNGLEHISPVIEEYVTDPTQEPDTAAWLTNIYYMVK